ncbi:MAG TPA: hypothetical protein PKA34_27485 [Blastocatellia bacterium]|nr:hypothetical protein [Blastocatellia bacterium]HMV86869.1 hypothetical protein [Blastocatellia bacterium]
MSFLRKLLWKYSAVVVVAIALSSEVTACSCIWYTPESALQEAQAVFVGKVLIANEKSRPSFFQRYIPFLRHSGGLVSTFEVSSVWKGQQIPRLVIHHSMGKCGRTFELGKEYLVYADGDQSNLSAGFCSRVISLEEAKEDFSIIGQGVVIARSDQTSMVKPFLWAMGVFSLLTLGAVIVAKKRRSSTAA